MSRKMTGHFTKKVGTKQCHFKTRMEERYGIICNKNKMEQLKRIVKKHPLYKMKRNLIKCEIELDNKNMTVVFDKKSNRIVTVY